MSRRRSRLVLLIVIWITFFAISLVTNVLGPLVPDIIRDFHLSLSLLATLPLSFFLAYGVCSIPAGILVEKYREKRVVLGAFVLVLLGSLAFALRHDYVVALGSLFTIGVGMALLQVAINPLLRVAGGEQHFAFFSVLGQLVFGLASFLSPFLYSFLVTRPNAGRMAWASLYWIFVGVAALMIVIVALTPFPDVVRTEEESAGTIAIYRALVKKPLVLAYFVGIFAYVGTEQGVANWMSEFLHTQHGLDPHTAGAQAVAWFWGLMTAGCALGLLLLRRLDSRVVLGGAVVLAIMLLSLGLFGPTPIARLALPAMGFAASVMWSVIFSLALNSVPEHHGAFSGILCTAIVGGAAVPFVIGALGDRYGLRVGMLVLFATLAYMLAVAVFACPLVVNETR